ncbi:MAG: Ig-like domain repeat protein [Chloroflexi bacterium]|nr:Ig-like domain repeat protein [Chloroflexota bacterium]
MLFHLPRPLYWLARLLALSALGILVAFRLPPGTAQAAQHPAARPDLPPAAQALVSATLGRAEARYHFQPTADGFRATDGANTWHAEFTAAGLRWSSGEGQWTMALHDVGVDAGREPVTPVAPAAAANSLEYRHPAFVEWYVNGPAGLEQGWTLNARPAGTGSRVTLSLSLEGAARERAGSKAIELLGEDGRPAFRYTGLVAYDATGRELRTQLAYSRLPSAAERGEVQIQVDDRGARYPLTIDPYVVVATLTNVNGVTGNWLGYTLAMSADGSTIAAGAPKGTSTTGAIYVFTRGAGSWATTDSPAAKLTNAAGKTHSVGNSVAISADGSTIVAGDFIAGGFGLSPGAVYVFARGSSGWATMNAPTATLTNLSGADYDQLGYSVAISGDGSTIAAGATGVSDANGSGAVYVFARGTGAWATTSTPTAQLTDASETSITNLGYSVAINADGSTIAAGATIDSTGYGAAYVFVRGAGSWLTTGAPVAKLRNASGAVLDWRTASLAISGDGSTIVVGADTVNSGNGAAYVFTRSAGLWVTTNSPTATLTHAGGVGEFLGISVAINGDGSTIVAGAPDAIVYKGAAYVFTRGASAWATTGTPTATLTNPSGAKWDYLGYGVGVSTDGSIAAGAPGVSSSKGAAYVFAFPLAHTTATTLQVAPDPSTFGQTVNLTATVSSGSGTPSGNVTFKDGSTTLGTASLTNGVASVSTAALSVGSHTLTAVYGGNTDFGASTSGVVTETVTALPPPQRRLYLPLLVR